MTGKRRASRSQGPPGPPVCRCRVKPVPVATWRRGVLVSVERIHYALDGCTLGREQLDPATYARS